MSSRAWLLLVYKVSPEPTARRVYAWRKLKRLGAILLHDAVWVLPNTAFTKEQLQWLAAEIVEMEGEALVWEAQLTMVGQAEALKAQFVAQADAAYTQLLSQLEQADCDLAALSKRYQQVSSVDYFQSPLGQRVRAALLNARGNTEP